MKTVIAKVLALLAVLLIVNQVQDCYATIYYLANNGNDNNNGLSTETPWKSIGHLGTQTFSPGDQILFRSGDTWREELFIKWSGTRENPIVFSSYGEGEKPAILGSTAITSWSQYSPNIWVSTNTMSDPSRGASHTGSTKGTGGWPGGSWFIRKDKKIVWGHQEKYLADGDLQSLGELYDWGWLNEKIYIYSEEDPNDIFSSMEVSQRDSAIAMQGNNPKDWITIDNLQLHFTQSKGFYSGWPTLAAQGLTISRCNIGWIGIKGGIAADGIKIWHSDTVIRDNEIHDCGRHGIGYLEFQTANLTISNVLIANNLFYNGWHTTGIDMQIEGTNTVMTNFEIRGNRFEGSKTEDLTVESGVESFNSNHVWVDTRAAGSKFTNLRFNNNIFTYMHGKGIGISNTENMQIINNTFYGVNQTLANYQAQLYLRNNLSEVIVENNIFFNNANYDVNSWFLCVHVEHPSLAELTFDYNLYYTTDPRIPFFDDYGGNNNYKTSDWTAYGTELQFDLNSPKPADPRINEKMSLFQDSPARKRGISHQDVQEDFYNRPMNSPPDLGAIQFISKGDINNDGFVTISDAIFGLQVITGTEATVNPDSDINGDKHIGIEEVLYIMGTLSE